MTWRQGRSAAAIVAVLVVGAPAGRADGPATATAAAASPVDNPRYTAWTRYKPGTSVTMASDVDAGQLGKSHVEVVRTLKSVTADAVTLTVASKMTLAGQDQPGTPTTQTIPAKEPTPTMTLTGAADVQAMGKTFKCKVYRRTDKAPPGPAGGAAGKATAYLSDDVPGGVVKLETATGTGKTLTFVLTAVDVK